jgi:hypothetical protein
MEVGPDAPLGFADTLPQAAEAWDAIRREHGLASPGLDEFIGQSFQFADFVFARTLTEAGPASAMSSIKIRAAGFNEVLYSDEMFAKWFARYQAEKLLPPR